MSKKESILDLIETELNFIFLNRSVKNERIAIERNTNVPIEYETDYDDCTFFDYLVFYKIERLSELGKISDSIKNLLINIYKSRKELISKKAKLIYDDFMNETESHKEEINLLYEKINQINAILLQYNLIPNDNLFTEFSLEEIIDRLIQSDNYNNVPNEEDINKALQMIK